ncbi:zinc finger protein 184-like isoform X2 [Elgaria multicarinata webbii]
MEEGEPAPAHELRERMEREGKGCPAVRLGIDNVVLNGSGRPQAEENPAVGLQREWEDQFLSFLKMAAPHVGETSPPPSVEYDMKDFQTSLKGVAPLGQWPGGEGVNPTLPGLNSETQGNLANFVNVKEEILAEEDSVGVATQERPGEKVWGPAAEVKSPIPEQDLSDAVKMHLSAEAKQEGDFLGNSNQALEYKEVFWPERPEQRRIGTRSQEKAAGECFQSLLAEEAPRVKQEVETPQESKPELALLCEEGATKVHRWTFHGGLLSSYERREGGPEGARSPEVAENRSTQTTGGKTYKCSYCGKCFDESLDLVAHERAHIGEKIYQCSHCEKRFSHRIDLLTHKKNHQGEKPHRCDPDCGKCFRQRAFPAAHRRAHPREQACQCSVCGERFSWRSNLIRHRRTHTGEKPYRCSECGKSYTRKTALERHKRIHMGERPCEGEGPSVGQASVWVLLV